MRRPLPERIINVKVKEVMTTNVRTCGPTTPLRDVACIMRDGDCGALPVADETEGSRVVGMVTDRDITVRLVASARNPLELTAASCMSTPVAAVGAEDSLTIACRVMEERKVRRLPVLDEAGRCIGIISQADVARHAPEARTGDLLQELSKPAA
jgi:CBS domain-containing protein